MNTHITKLPLCAHCGKKPARTWEGKASKYCSKECGSKAKAEKSRAAALALRGKAAPVARKSRNAKAKPDTMFTAPPVGMDFRDANFCPLG